MKKYLLLEKIGESSEYDNIVQTSYFYFHLAPSKKGFSFISFNIKKSKNKILEF